MFVYVSMITTLHFVLAKRRLGKGGAYGEGVRVGFHRAKHWQECLNTWSRQGFQATGLCVHVCLRGHVLLFRWTYEGVPVWQSNGLKLHAGIGCTSGTGSVAYGLRKGYFFLQVQLVYFIDCTDSLISDR